MASQPERRSTRSSNPDNTSQTKRKSDPSHKSPIAPSTSIIKQSTSASKKTGKKTQTTLTPLKTALVNTTGTNSTVTSRTIKQEKIDDVSKTPNPKTSPIVLSSTDEDDLYSQDPYEETVDFTKDPDESLVKATTAKSQNKNTVTPNSSITSTRNKQTGRHNSGGHTLVSQGRCGRGGQFGGSLKPPPQIQSKAIATSTSPKTPLNLTKDFDRESKGTVSSPPIAPVPPTEDKTPKSDKPNTSPLNNEKHLKENEGVEQEPKSVTSSTKKPLTQSDITTTTTGTTVSSITDEFHNTQEKQTSSVNEENSTLNDTTTSKPSNLKPGKYQSDPNKKVQANLSGSPINSTRYSMNFPVTIEQHGTKGMREALITIFSAMKDLCPDITILPWKEDGSKECLKTPDGIPTTITLLQKYFDGARGAMSAGRVYSKINIGYPITADRATFQNDFEGWCKDSDIKFYRASVQYRNVKTICWLAYLTNHTNCQLLSQKMTNTFKASMGKSVEIGLSWRLLNSQKDVPKGSKVYAVHVECPYESMAIVKRFLRSCSHQKVYPGGTKFHVINEFWPYMTEINKRKYRYMKDKHKYFLDQIGLCSTAQPLDIDRRIPGTKETIRTILLNIRTKTDNHRVFHSIGIRWNSSTIFNLTYRPDKKSLTNMYCNSLSTYAHHKFPDADLSKIFSLDAIDKAHEETYDPEKQTFVTQEDIAMQMEINNDRDDDSLNWGDYSELRPVEDDASDLPSVVEVRNPKLFDLTGENESVSTLGTSSVTFNEQDNQEIVDTTSHKTDASTTSQRTRIESLENHSKSTSTEVAAMRNEMSSFINLIKKTLPTQPAAPAQNEEQAAGDE